MTIFKKSKKYKLKKEKRFSKMLVKGMLIGALVGAGVGAASIELPKFLNSYNLHNYATEQRVEVDDFVSTNNVASNEYTKCPYTFEGDVKAFIDSSELFGGAFPVMQSDDNEYYLYHDIDGYGNGSASHSSIFKDYRNDESLRDDFTIIYGHNMSDGSMFGKLAKYSDKDSKYGDFADVNGQNLYNEVNNITYTDKYVGANLEIFAAGTYDASSFYDCVGDFNSEEDFYNFLASVLSNSDLDVDNSKIPTYGDHIVCFWTCGDFDAKDYYGSSDENAYNKVLVFAKVKVTEKYQDFDLNNETSMKKM